MHFVMYSQGLRFLCLNTKKRKFSSVVLFICLTSKRFAKDFQKQLHFGVQSQWQLAVQSKYFSEKLGWIGGRLRKRKSIKAIDNCA